jgi:hypothetical protein
VHLSFTGQYRDRSTEYSSVQYWSVILSTFVSVTTTLRGRGVTETETETERDRDRDRDRDRRLSSLLLP